MTTSLDRAPSRCATAVSLLAPAPTAATKVYSLAVRYEFSCLPPGHVDRRAFTLFVQERSDGRWCVTDSSGYLTLSRTGQWDHETPIGHAPAITLPMHRDKAWRDEHRFDLMTARALAEAHAPLIRVNGRTALELQAPMRSGRKAAIVLGDCSHGMNPQIPQLSEDSDTQFWIEDNGIQAYQESRAQFAAGNTFALEDPRSEFSN